MAELERRLKTRAQDSDEVVKKRMRKATDEISHWQEYDYVLINQDLGQTLEKIDSILKAERLKRVSGQEGLAGFIKGCDVILSKVCEAVEGSVISSLSLRGEGATT